MLHIAFESLFIHPFIHGLGRLGGWRSAGGSQSLAPLLAANREYVTGRAAEALES